eukprot:scaffold2069_cov254-Pinguiococcus_pyrenoidosus.AAC.21
MPWHEPFMLGESLASQLKPILFSSEISVWSRCVTSSNTDACARIRSARRHAKRTGILACARAPNGLLLNGY